MRMTMSAWVVIAAAFACSVGVMWPSSASVSSSSLELEGGERTPPPLRYKVISFSTAGATEETYSRFVQEIRDHVVHVGDERHGIPVLRDPSTVPSSELFLLVALSNRNGQTVTFALMVTNLYLEAYRVRDEAFFFPNSNPNAASLVFTDATSSYTLTFGNNYDGLERVAGNRDSVDLGMDSLDQAITSLTFSNSEPARARSLLVVIQMVSEAARYRLIQGRMNTRIRTGVSSPPDAGVLSLENHWGRLSTEIQNSNEGGAFDGVVQLQNARYEPVLVDNVNTIAPYIALIFYVCAGRRADLNDHIHDQQSSAHTAYPMLIIRPVVGHQEETCSPSAAPVRIVGRDGLCVDIRKGQYNDGNPIQLWPCSTNTSPNQLWSLEADGTIRSNGKCLTTYGYSPGVYVMIYNCVTAEKLATIWQVWDNGTIINPQSGLALAATSGASGATLTVQTNDYALSQGWRATNVTAPLVTSIVGFRGLCLRASGRAVWVEACDAGTKEQQWALYQDGSIRPNGDRGSCLTADEALKLPAGIINVSSCGPASPAQRWVFARDGTILNLRSGLVMDVAASDPSQKKIIVYPTTGGPNQQWLPML